MVTVLMATRNRARQLAQTLDRYTELRPPQGGWKLVVVDNGSSDDTQQVLQSFQDRLPLVALFEAEPGKTRALNRGLQAMEGELVIFTDDDILPCAGWLQVYEQACQNETQYGIFGGPIRPRFPCPPPPWAIADEKIAAACFATTLTPEVSHPVSPVEVVGGNFAVRAGSLQRSGGFNVELGPRPGSSILGDETELLVRLARQGEKIFFLAGAWVEHVIGPERLSRPWMLQRAVMLGRAYYHLADTRKARRWAGVPRYLIRLWLSQRVAALTASVRRDGVGEFVSLWWAGYYWGQILEAWRYKGRDAQWG